MAQQLTTSQQHDPLHGSVVLKSSCCLGSSHVIQADLQMQLNFGKEHWPAEVTSGSHKGVESGAGGGGRL